MSIEIVQRAILSAHLEAKNGAEIYARRRDDSHVFEVGLSKDLMEGHGGVSWYFDEDACREAAEFFTKLADDLADKE